MAGKSAMKKDFQGKVERLLRNGDLFEPAEDLVSQMYLLPEVKGNPAKFLDAIRPMIQSAQERAASSKFSKQGKRWLKSAARALNDYQLVDRDWISKNVWELPKPKPRQESRLHDDSETKDIRYTDEDRARGHVDIITCDVSREEEDKMLMSSPNHPSMEVDLDPSILDSPSPRRSPRKHSKPISVVQVVEHRSRDRSRSSRESRPSSGSRGPCSSVKVPVKTPSPSLGSTCSSWKVPAEPGKSGSSGAASRLESSGKSKSTKDKDEIVVNASEQPGLDEIPPAAEIIMGKSSSSKDSDCRRITRSSSSLGLKITVGKRKAEEDAVSNHNTSKRKREYICRVPGCTAFNASVKGHCYQNHVPGIFQELLSVDDLAVLRGRVSALKTAAAWMFGRPAELQELMDHIVSLKLLALTDNSAVNEVQRKAMVALCNFHRWTVPETFRLYPANSLTILIHWKVVVLICSRLEESERESWIRLFPKPVIGSSNNQESEKVLLRPEAFDAHFHLDRTLDNCRLPAHGTLKDILAKVPVNPGERIQLVGSVSVFCDPKTYPTEQRIAEFPENMCVAVGFHPKHAHYSQQSIDGYLRSLKSLLAHPRVVALGEVGLDHSDNRKYWPAQMDLLERLLPLMRRNQVLVLHCRGMDGDCGTEAFLLMLHLLKKHVDPHHPIHVHCFTGNQFVLQRWIEVFPQSYFGVTNMVSKFGEDQILALRSIREDRLLLESDAPYFAIGSRCSSPGQLFTVAKAVARIRNVPVKQILETTVANGRNLYQWR